MKARATRKPRASQLIDQAAPSMIQRRYRVGSVTKTGRLNWAYSELMTLDEAEEIALSSRLTALAPGFCPPTARLIQLSPRAAKRLEKLRAVPKPTQTRLATAVSTDQVQFGARLNNGMLMLEELAESFGVDLEFSAVNNTRTPVLTASALFADRLKFQFEGETDQALIAGARKLVSDVIQRLTKFDDHLSQRQPSPLPAGLWTIRNANGERLRSSLYPLASIPKGCKQAFEPASPSPTSSTKPFRILDDEGNVIHETETKGGAAEFIVARGYGTIFKIEADGSQKHVRLPPFPRSNGN